VPLAYPKEFRRDVIAVARKGDQTMAKVARSFGVSESCLARWLRLAARDDGLAGKSQSVAAGGDLETENRELRKRTKQLEQENVILRRGDGLLRPRRPPKMMFPLVRGHAADTMSVAVTRRVLGFSKQAFYRWLAHPVTQRDWDDAHLIHAARDIHHDDPAFGYRYLRDELAEQGIVASRNGVNRLCTQQRMWSVHSRKRGLNRKPGPPVHDDLVLRDFTAAVPNQLWLTDITQHPTAQGKLYLCAVKDACSRRIVGYSIDNRMTSALAVHALRNALSLLGHIEAIVHSDRGSQFRSNAYVCELRGAQLRGSMGRVGACADNAAMKAFFSLLQKNVLNRQRWHTREDLRLAIVVWIENTHHRRRRQDGLGRLTPIEFETLTQTAHAA